jgi:Trypsin/SdrD B-like domain
LTLEHQQLSNQSRDIKNFHNANIITGIKTMLGLQNIASRLARVTQIRINSILEGIKMKTQFIQSLSVVVLFGLGLAACGVTSTTASITGVVFDDLNGNNQRDAGEPGLKDWTLYLDTNSNAVLDAGERSTLSSSTGAYSFSDVPTGPVKIGVHLHLGFSSVQPISLSSSDLEPAKQTVQTKIINGTVVDNTSAYPFQVALVRKADGSQFCGGSLIAPHWVLTAAHCFYNKSTQDTFADAIQVRVGVTDLTTTLGQTIDVASIFNHPQYLAPSTASFNNDMALLKLSANATMGTLIEPAGPNDTNLNAGGTAVRVIGWGRTEANAPSLQLREVPQELTTDDACKVAFPSLTGVQLCARTPTGDTTVRESCSGDSGGPLFTQNAPLRQVGVVSFGSVSCTEINTPGVYARVSSFDAWLGTTTGRPAADVDLSVNAANNAPGVGIAAQESK